MKVNGAEVEQISYETDRSKFIGRGNGLAEPRALTSTEPLSGSQGAVWIRLSPLIQVPA